MIRSRLRVLQNRELSLKLILKLCFQVTRIRQH
jgi:hypothetical protein